MLVPLHQFLIPPFASILTPMSWPRCLEGMFLLGSRAAQDKLDYRNHEESCAVSPTQLQEKTLHIASLLVVNYHASG